MFEKGGRDRYKNAIQNTWDNWINSYNPRNFPDFRRKKGQKKNHLSFSFSRRNLPAGLQLLHK